MSRAQPDLSTVAAVVGALDAGLAPPSEQLKQAVRGLLGELVRRAPGRSVEVRVPPFGAIQCIAGPRHTRGTPPNVIETDGVTWVALATGRLSWPDAVASGRARASGVRTDLAGVFPLWSD